MENVGDLAKKNPAVIKAKIIAGVVLLIFFTIVGILNYMNQGSGASVSISSDYFNRIDITEKDFIYTYQSPKEHQTNILYFLLDLETGEKITMSINIYTYDKIFELEKDEDDKPKLPTFEGFSNEFSKKITFEAEGEKTSYSNEEIDEMANKYKYDLDINFEPTKTTIVYVKLEEEWQINKFSFFFESVK